MSESGMPPPPPLQSGTSNDSMTTPRRSGRLRRSTVCSSCSSTSSRHSILPDNTEIDVPTRRSWWKKIDDNSINIKEVFGDKVPDGKHFDIENIVQANADPSNMKIKTLAVNLKNMSESSTSESLASIQIPQRKLFTQRQTQELTELKNINKNPTQASTTNMEQASDTSVESLGSIQLHRRTLFTQEKTKPDNFVKIMKKRESLRKKFNESEKTVHTPIDVVILKKNLFGNKQKTNVFAFPISIMSETDDDTLEVQDRLTAFKKIPQVTSRSRCASASSRSSKRAYSPASLCSETTKIEYWKHLPSSTMIDEHFLTSTPNKKLSIEKTIPVDIIIKNNENQSHEITTKIDQNERYSEEKQATNDKNAMELKGVSKSASKDESKVEGSDKSKTIERYDYNLVQGDKSKVRDSSNSKQRNRSKLYSDDEIYENNFNNKNESVNKVYQNLDAQSKENEIEEHKIVLRTNNESYYEQEKSNIQNNVDNHSQGKHYQLHNINDNIQENENNKADKNIYEYICEQLENYIENENSIQDRSKKKNTAESDNEGASKRKSSEQENSHHSVDKSRDTDVETNQSLKTQNETQVENDSQEGQYESHGIRVNENQQEDNRSKEQNESEEEQNVSQKEKHVSKLNNDKQDTISDNQNEEVYNSEQEEYIEDMDVSENNEEMQCSLEDEFENKDEEINQEQNISDADNDFRVLSFKNRRNDTTRSTQSKSIRYSHISEDEKSNSKSKNGSSQFFAKNVNSSNIDPGRMSTAEHFNRYSADFSKNIYGGARSSTESSGWNANTKAYIERAEHIMNERKSLRALVLNKSAKSRPSTEQKKNSVDDVEQDLATTATLKHVLHDTIVNEFTINQSVNITQTEITEYLNNITRQNLQHRQKIQDKVKRSLKRPVSDPNCEQTYLKWSKPKVQETPHTRIPSNYIKRNKHLNTLVSGAGVQAHKPPKLVKPPKATWINVHLYKFIYDKLLPKHNQAQYLCDEFVNLLYYIFKECLKKTTDTHPLERILKEQMALMGLVTTHFEFYKFLQKYMPKEFCLKMVPDLFNGLPIPADVFSDIVI